MSRLITLILFLYLLVTVAKANDVATISGTVTNGMGLPLKSVMVRSSIKGKNGNFVMTDTKGSYTLQIDSEEDSIKLTFSKIGYEQEKVTVASKSQRLDIILSKSAAALPEVTVSTPEVRLRGDTLSFLLAAFAGKDDVSLKDALKKVPGVEVSSSGEISYNGKKISNFYIEGMDLMGGKYDIATTNIPASYVNAIEILNNHKDRKIDRNLFSDNVAMNIRLKPTAKIRPTGTYSASAGIGSNPMPLAASGAGMLFRDKLQSILTLKGSDIKEFSRRESYRFFDEGREECKDYAESILGRLSSSQPPLSRHRWIKPIDASATANVINKINDDATLRCDAGYSFLQTAYDYSDSRIYFDGNHNIVIDQASRPQSWSHNPSLSLEYKVNKDNLYLRNCFSGKGAFSTDITNVTAAASYIREKERLKNFNLNDEFDWSWIRDKWRLNFNSLLNFNASPEGYKDITSTSADQPSGNLLQQARSYTLLVAESFHAARDIKRSRISLPINFKYTNCKIRTALSYLKKNTSEEILNHLNGSSIQLSASPVYEYTSPYEKLFVMANIPITLQHINWNNSGTRPDDCICTHLLYAPSIYLNYKLSAKSTFRLQASYKNSIGDILDLLTAPIMKDYLSASYHSGQLSKSKSLNVSLHYDFKLPLSFWYFNADVAYSSVSNNLLSRQDVNEGLIETSDFLMPHHNDMLNTTIGISKNIRSINTKISLRGGWSNSRNEIEQNGQLVRYHGGNIYVNPSITSQPWEWLGISYDGTISSASSRYLGRKQSFASQNHNIGLSFFPFRGFQLRLSSEIIRKEIEEGRHHTLPLFDARIAYKFKKIRLTCDLNNILDRKSYSYTIFNALDRFTYNYHLRGRELILSIEYHL